MTNYVDAADLTLKQKLFCQHYIKNGYNATQAAISAGYSKNAAKVLGYETLTKPYVKKYIAETMKETLEKLGAGIDYRVKALKQCVDAGLQGKANKDGCVDIDGVVKTIDVINKMDGSYAPQKQEITAQVEVTKIDDLVKEYEKDA